MEKKNMDSSNEKIKTFKTKEELEEARRENPNLLPVRICNHKHLVCTYRYEVESKLICRANRKYRRQMGC